jgi:hypothetical protein
MLELWAVVQRYTGPLEQFTAMIEGGYGSMLKAARFEAKAFAVTNAGGDVSKSSTSVCDKVRCICYSWRSPVFLVPLLALVPLRLLIPGSLALARPPVNAEAAVICWLPWLFKFATAVSFLRRVLAATAATAATACCND